MMEITVNENVLKVSELPDSNIQFVSFKLEESIQGVLPKAEIQLRCNRDQVENISESIITIIDKDGNSQEGNMYVYDLEFFNNVYTIKLLGCTPEFTRETHISKYTSIKNAIDSLSPNEIVSQVESDILNDIEIYQMNETNYKLCTRLLKAWRKNTIFGYSLDGLRMIDISNYQAIDTDIFSSGGSLDVLSPSSLTKPKLSDLEIEFIDYNSDSAQIKDETHLYVKFDKQLIPINADYKDLVANYIFNSKFDNMAAGVNYKSRFLSPVNICDGIIIKGNNTDEFASVFDTENMFITSKTIQIRNQSVEVDYTLKSMNP